MKAQKVQSASRSISFSWYYCIENNICSVSKISTNSILSAFVGNNSAMCFWRNYRGVSQLRLYCGVASPALLFKSAYNSRNSRNLGSNGVLWVATWGSLFDLIPCMKSRSLWMMAGIAKEQRISEGLISKSVAGTKIHTFFWCPKELCLASLVSGHPDVECHSSAWLHRILQHQWKAW